MSHGVGVTSITGAATIKVSGSSGSITLTDVGVTAVNAGTGITTNVTTGSVTVTNAGVTGFNGQTGSVVGVGSVTGGGGISASASTGSVTVSLNMAYTSTTLGVVAFTTATTWTNLGSVSIPSAGVWRVYANLRIREDGTTAEFIKSGLFTSATSGSGAILNNGTSNERMMIERVASIGSSFLNMLCTPEWIVSMPTGLSYPYNIYLQVYSSGADAQALNNNDSNGRPIFNAYQISATGPSGTTINSY
jgi:hypothetical protein